MIEKRLLQAVEPLVEDIVKLEKRLDEIVLTPGPQGEPGEPGKDGAPGADADPLVVAEVIVSKHADLIRGQKGDSGKDGEPGPQGEPGLPGKDADPEVVAGVIVEKHADLIRGAKGDPGPQGEPGKDGVDASPEAVAGVLVEKHADVLRGQKGDPGPAGEPGRDGVDADPDVVASVIVEKHADRLRGERGERGADGLGIQTKAWEPGIYREGTFITAEIGRTYKALRDTSGEPGKSEDWERVGTGGFAFKGLKKDGAVYQDGDLYIDGGSLFMWLNNKGRMVVQRGQKGDTGEKGADGKDAPGVVAVKAHVGGMSFVFDDGNIIDADVDGLTEMVHAIAEGVAERKALLAIEQQDVALTQLGTPIKVFRGVYLPDKEYSPGDVVRNSNSTWLCIKTVRGSLNGDYWVKLAGMGGGGGGGGGGAGGWNYLALQDINMVNHSITNLAPPRVGAFGAADAVNRAYVDANAGTVIQPVPNTATLNAAAGANDNAKLDSFFAPAPKNGDVVIVQRDTTPGADNSKAGIWRNAGGTWSRIVDMTAPTPRVLNDLSDVSAAAPTDKQVLTYNGAASRWEATANTAAPIVSHFAAAAVAGVATTGQTPVQVLTAQYAALNAGVAARQGTFAVVDPGTGTNAQYSGVYYYDGTNWTAFANAKTAAGGGADTKNLVADPDVVLATNPRPTGATQYTLENNAKEIKAVDGAGNWNLIYSETNIRNLIAQSRSFRGTIVETGSVVVGTTPLNNLASESSLTATDLGTYFVFVGASHTIGASEIGGAISNVDGILLSPGDWLQVANLGTVGTPRYGYVVIHGDTLSMARARAVFGHNVWADGAYEQGSIVRYQPTPTSGLHYYISSANVIAGDAAPGAVAAAPPAGAGTAITFGMPDGLVDGTVIHFVFTPVGGGAPVTFDHTVVAANHPASQLAVGIKDAMNLDPAVQAFGTATLAAGNSVTLTAANPFTATADQGVTITVTTPMAPVANKWTDITPVGRLSDLADTAQLATATGGQVPVWSAANARWEPGSTTQPLMYMGNGAWTAAQVASATDNFGMPTGTIPSPQTFLPQTGDIYVDLQSGTVTQFTGTPAGGRTVSTITGGTTSTSLDFNKGSLSKLTDVDLRTANPTEGQVLTYNATTSTWVPRAVATTLGALTDVTESPSPTAGNLLVAVGDGTWTEQANPSYTKAEINTRLDGIITGFAHDIAVLDILNTPPTNPDEEAAYIVGISPTAGAWAAHANDIAIWTSGQWEYQTPRTAESHLVEAKQAIYSWQPLPPPATGSRWVKVASTAASTGASARNGIGEIIPWLADTIPDSYLECKGQIVAVAAYPDLFAVIGSKYNGSTAADGVTTFALPNLQGYFLRGAGGSATGALGSTHDWTTGMPKSPFSATATADANGNHRHDTNVPVWSDGSRSSWNDLSTHLTQKELANFDGSTPASPWTSMAGDHSHTLHVTVAGGDSETAPAHMLVRWVIRVKAIDGGAQGPRGLPGAGAPAVGTDGQIIVARSGVWVAENNPLPSPGTATDQLSSLTVDNNGRWVRTGPALVTRINQDGHIRNIADNVKYTMRGYMWPASDTAITLEFFLADQTTQISAGANFSVWGASIHQVNPTVGDGSNSSQQDCQSHRGWTVLNNKLAFWPSSNKWKSGQNLCIELLITTFGNTKSQGPFMELKISGMDTADRWSNGHWSIRPPDGQDLGMVYLTAAEGTNYPHFAIEEIRSFSY